MTTFSMWGLVFQQPAQLNRSTKNRPRHKYAHLAVQSLHDGLAFIEFSDKLPGGQSRRKIEKSKIQVAQHCSEEVLNVRQCLRQLRRGLSSFCPCRTRAPSRSVFLRPLSGKSQHRTYSQRSFSNLIGQWEPGAGKGRPLSSDQFPSRAIAGAMPLFALCRIEP